MHALPRIAEIDPASGYLMESLMAAIAQGGDEAKPRLKDFLEKRGAKVTQASQNQASAACTRAPRRCARCGSAPPTRARAPAGRHDLRARRIRSRPIPTS